MDRIKTVVEITLVMMMLVACANKTEMDMQEITQTVTEVMSTEVISTEEVEVSEVASTVTLYVDLAGAVVNPGVYEVKTGTRIFELITLAGGFQETAAKNYVNQAREVVDEEQIMILTLAEVEELELQGLCAPQGTKEQAVEKDGKIDINRATKEQLCTVNGVGESKANAIIAYREEHGEFQTIEDIKRVTGIKDGMYEKMKDYITVVR